jgi:trk system potassium uptake protein TrkA
MRIAFVGASDVAVVTARLLLSRGHEVVIVEEDHDLIESLYDELDCSFIHGDGTKPAILSEIDPESSDALFCVTGSDQANIIASLVGRSLGFPRVVTSIEDPGFESICLELGLEHTIVPTRTISRYLADMIAGIDVLELSTFIRGEARFFMFTAHEREHGKCVRELELPADARAVCYYRDGAFRLAADDTRLHEGDEVVILTHARHLPELTERWQPITAAEPVA